MYMVGVFDAEDSHFHVVARSELLEEAVAEAEKATAAKFQAIVFTRFSKGYRVLWPKKLVLGQEVP